MDDNKAMDERTAKDKQEAEKAAALEIEATFPSYFDELSKEMTYNMGIKIDDEDDDDRINQVFQKPSEVSIDRIVFELTEIDDVNEDIYRSKWLSL